jgi:glucokinase
MERLAIGIDLGCTQIKAILVKEDGTILHELREDTHEHDDQHWKNAVRIMIAGLTQKTSGSVLAIGLSAPGLADVHNTSIACMPGRLPGLEYFNWTDFTGKTVHVLNDAHAALMAESSFGAAKNLRHVVMLTLGTGVGGGILIDGKLYQGVAQMAGHLGHVTVHADDAQQDVTNMPGSLEDAVGNLTIGKRSGGSYQSTWELVQAYERGDAFACEVWLASVRRLAVGIAGFINVLSPEAVIIGGGISKADEVLLKPLNDYLDRYEWRPLGKKTPVVLAQHSDLAGALGAAGFALQRETSMA